MNPNHETIHKHNSREKSGKKPGAQPGHKHHGRKKHEPTDKIQIPPPDVYLDTDRYLPTGKTITRQLVKVHVITEVTEYSTPEYRDKKTRQRVHAPFPDGVIDDVNYDGTLISDHEAALIKHGSQHQECLAHLLRYAKAGMENEPDKTWHKKLAE